MKYIYFLLVLLAILNVQYCQEEEIAETKEDFTIQGRIKQLEKSELQKVKVTAQGGSNSELNLANVAPDGKFSLNVPAGSYFLEINSPNFIFGKIRVDISSKQSKIKARYINETSTYLPHPLKITPISNTKYFDERIPFNPLDLVKSPMGIMILVTLGMLVFVPKMMDGIDEETMAEIQGNQAQPEAINLLPNWSPQKIGNK